MSNCIKFCSCRMCKLGKRSPYSKSRIRRKLKGTRIKNKMVIRKGLYDNVSSKISMPYTD